MHKEQKQQNKVADVLLYSLSILRFTAELWSGCIGKTDIYFCLIQETNVAARHLLQVKISQSPHHIYEDLYHINSSILVCAIYCNRLYICRVSD